MTGRGLLAFTVAFIPTSLAAQVGPAEPLVVGETFTIESQVLGETRRINVYAPAAYQGRDGPALPVLYMPDGGMGEDFLHVAGLVQIGSLELHSWCARRDRLDRPDRMVIDLDPDESLPFEAVIDAALRIRDRLRDAGLVPYVMTTGGKGVHVVAPLRRTAGWDPVREAARALAHSLQAEEPDRFIAKASKTAREGRIFIDWMRNGFGATSINAYSTRARPGAPVATPLSWQELEAGVRAGDFNVETVPDRLRTLERDPWTDFRRSARSMSRSVRARLAPS